MIYAKAWAVLMVHLHRIKEWPHEKESARQQFGEEAERLIPGLLAEIDRLRKSSDPRHSTKR